MALSIIEPPCLHMPWAIGILGGVQCKAMPRSTALAGHVIHITDFAVWFLYQVLMDFPAYRERFLHIAEERLQETNRKSKFPSNPISDEEEEAVPTWNPPA